MAVSSLYFWQLAKDSRITTPLSCLLKLMKLFWQRKSFLVCYHKSETHTCIVVKYLGQAQQLRTISLAPLISQSYMCSQLLPFHSKNTVWHIFSLFGIATKFWQACFERNLNCHNLDILQWSLFWFSSGQYVIKVATFLLILRFFYSCWLRQS